MMNSLQFINVYDGSFLNILITQKSCTLFAAPYHINGIFVEYMSTVKIEAVNPSSNDWQIVANRNLCMSLHIMYVLAANGMVKTATKRWVSQELILVYVTHSMPWNHWSQLKQVWSSQMILLSKFLRSSGLFV